MSQDYQDAEDASPPSYEEAISHMDDDSIAPHHQHSMSSSVTSRPFNLNNEIQNDDGENNDADESTSLRGAGTQVPSAPVQHNLVQPSAPPGSNNNSANSGGSHLHQDSYYEYMGHDPFQRHKNHHGHHGHHGHSGSRSHSHQHDSRRNVDSSPSAPSIHEDPLSATTSTASTFPNVSTFSEGANSLPFGRPGEMPGFMGRPPFIPGRFEGFNAMNNPGFGPMGGFRPLGGFGLPGGFVPPGGFEPPGGFGFGPPRSSGSSSSFQMPSIPSGPMFPFGAPRPPMPPVPSGLPFSFDTAPPPQPPKPPVPVSPSTIINREEDPLLSPSQQEEPLSSLSGSTSPPSSIPPMSDSQTTVSPSERSIPSSSMASGEGGSGPSPFHFPSLSSMTIPSSLPGTTNFPGLMQANDISTANFKRSKDGVKSRDPLLDDPYQLYRFLVAHNDRPSMHILIT
ncbi:hypothetical protein BGZ49_004333, partial [Haplosporangium sp. Z 27]